RRQLPTCCGWKAGLADPSLQSRGRRRSESGQLSLCRFGGRNSRADLRSRAVRINLQSAAELPEAFLHSRYSHTQAGRISPDLLQHVGTNALPSICNFQRHLVRMGGHANRGAGAPGVPQDVCETLLDDAEQGSFHFLWKPSQVLWQLDIDLNAAAASEPLDEPVQRGSQSELVQQGWMQQIGESADLLGAFFCDGQAFREGS